MGRQLRPACTGAVFHITARTQWQEPLFRGIERQVAALIRGSIDRSDTRLLAYAVMSNHIHVVVVQGRRPLAGYMQPLLRRIALLTNRHHRKQGHVFDGRYDHSLCQDPDYFRSLIAYVHMNPVRAGICARPEQYAWTSHRDYAHGPERGAPALYVHAVERALRVFARASRDSIAQYRRDYRRYIRWRIAFDAYLDADEDDTRGSVPAEPVAVGGDRHWQEDYGTAATMRIAHAEPDAGRRIDLRDHVVAELEHIAPNLPLELLRSGGRSRPLVRVRNEVIARAITAGYRTGKLAMFLNISPSVVSAVRARLRELSRS